MINHKIDEKIMLMTKGRARSGH